jgi:hypothetical protein
LLRDVILHWAVLSNTVNLFAANFELEISVEGSALSIVDVVGRSYGDSVREQYPSAVADCFGDWMNEGEFSCEFLKRNIGRCHF